MDTSKSWDRLLWGVLFQSGTERPMLIGGLWDERLKDRNFYPDEPTRPILFTTRHSAREWCREKTKKYNNSQNKDLRAWKFRPVRVRETVKEIK